jgi:transposase-like protein
MCFYKRKRFAKRIGLDPKKTTKEGRYIIIAHGGVHMNEKYSDEFKLKVIQDYYNSPLGVRSIALKYNLPSKNYINNWEEYLIKKGILPPGSTKPNKTVGRTSEKIVRQDDRTEREKRYEDEIRELKARVEFLESLDSLKPFLKKN